ncbi:MAG: glycosyltransferase family 2 protein [Microcoleaceae cyanobacterium]
MRLSTCTTVRNAPERLDHCLKAIWRSTVKPHAAIVSDDSSDPQMQQKHREIVEKYPGTRYILGPQRGVNANRNCAVNSVKDTDLIAFVDDDIWLDPDFIEKAIARYSKLSPEQQQKTFLTGVSYTQSGQEKNFPTKLSFRGFYRPTDSNPECVHIHAAVFPRSFFDVVQWEEEIFFGQGDAILCLRALKLGYQIIFCKELRALDTRPRFEGEKNTLDDIQFGKLTDYDIHQIAARLYIGVKRYKELFPSPFKLLAFLSIYFPHTTQYLIRKKALNAWPDIIQRSRFLELW